MSDVWNDQNPPGFTVQRVTPDGSGGDFVRGRPDTRQNAVRFKVRSASPSTASSKISIKSTVTAVTTGYGKIDVSWGWPDSYSDWTEVAVVRSGFGHPSTVNDGVTIFRSTRDEYEFFDSDGNPLTITVEDSPLQPGRWYYYTVFFYRQTWEPVMYAEALTPRDFAHFDHLWNSIPEYYRWVDGRFRIDQGHLQQFLRVLGFELDLTREYVESWQELYHVDNSPLPLLLQLGLNLGVGNDQGLGPIRMRSLIGQINELYDMRGTEYGLRKLIETSSKYTTTITMGRNLLLLPDDSEFISGSGNWVLSTTGVPKFLYERYTLSIGKAYNAVVTATSSVFSITTKELISSVAKLTTSVNHNFSTGQLVTVSGVDSIFDGTYTITATTSNTFSYAKSSASTISSTSATGSAFVNRNHIGVRGSDIAVADSYAFDADISATPSPREVTLTTLTAGVTTADYSPDSGTGVLLILVKDEYGTGDVTISCGFGTNDSGQALVPRFNSVPVEEGYRYGFTCEFKGTNTYSAVTAGIYWFNQYEYMISQSVSTSSITGNWQTVTVQDDAPTDAIYGVPFVTVSGRASGNSYRMMGCMFYMTGAGGTVTPLAPDYYLTMGADELIGETAGYVMGG